MKMLIAEIGVNWSDISEFEVMLSRLANVGCKYAKGQIFTKDYKAIEKYPSLINNVLTFEQAKHLMDYAEQLGITLFWTPSEDAAVDTVIALKPEFIKIAHTHYDNQSMADKVNASGIQAIVSVPYHANYEHPYNTELNLACLNEYPPSNDKLKLVYMHGGVSLHSPHLTPYILSGFYGTNIIEVHVKQTDDCIDSCVSISIEDFGVLKRELDFIWGET